MSQKYLNLQVTPNKEEQKAIDPADSRLNNTDLIGRMFTFVNAFKRHRALEQINRQEKDYDKANYHELKQYKLFDNMELTLRAIQKGQRELDEQVDTE